MSATATVTTPQEAHALLTERILVPVFLEKLAADFGIAPQSEQDLEKLLAIGSRLMAAHEHEQVKQAGVQASFLDQALANLDGEMKKAGYVGSTNEEQLIKNASANLAADPEIAAAIRVFSAGLGREMNAAA